MSITLRKETDTSQQPHPNLLSDGAITATTKNSPLTASEVDKNFITLKQKVEEIEADYDTTFNSNGTIKDNAIVTESIADGSISGAKIKNHSVTLTNNKNIVSITDNSTKANFLEGAIENYIVNSGASTLPANSVIYVKAGTGNTGSVMLNIKDVNTETDAETSLINGEVLKQGNTSLSSGDIIAGAIYTLFYDGSTIQVVNTLPDPVVTVQESISRVQTFGPLTWTLTDLEEAHGTFISKEHLLNGRPSSFSAYWECLDTEHGYESGDLVPFELARITNTNSENPITLKATATHVEACLDTGVSNDPVILPQPNAAGMTGALTDTKWQLVVRGNYKEDDSYSPAYIERDLSFAAYKPSSAVTIGNYLYMINRADVTSTAHISKINLITNKVTYISGNVGAYSQLSHVRLPSGDAGDKLVSAGISDAGSGYAVGDEVIVLKQSGDSTGISGRFVISSVTTTGSPTGKVTGIYPISNNTAANADANAGKYNQLPTMTDGVYTVLASGSGGTTGSGTGLKIVPSFAPIALGKVYVTGVYSTAYGYTLGVFEPTGNDTKESVSAVANSGTQSRFTIQEIEGSEYYGFITQGKYRAQINSTILYHAAGSQVEAVQKTFPSFLGYDEILKFEQGATGTYAGLTCIQWNPIKRRIYVSNGTTYLHILEFTPETTGNLNTITPSTSNLKYKKTIGLPGGGGITHHKASDADNINVDFDMVTGEEKSITVTRCHYSGSVSRLAWKED